MTLPGVTAISSHECDIELSGVRAEDEGEWRCEMESYVWGLVRGYTDHRLPKHICFAASKSYPYLIPWNNVDSTSVT